MPDKFIPRRSSMGDLSKAEKDGNNKRLQKSVKTDDKTPLNGGLLTRHGPGDEQTGSWTSINSFVSAKSSFPGPVHQQQQSKIVHSMSSPVHSTSTLLQPVPRPCQHPIWPNSPPASPFHFQPVVHSASRLPTNSSISMAGSFSNQRSQMPKAKGANSLREARDRHFLSVPSFLVSPPTPNGPSMSASAMSLDRKSLKQLYKDHRGELSANEQYRYALSRAQLKASSRTSALFSGFAMIALVELLYQRTTPPFLLISLAVVTTLLVSVHLLTLLMSTCLLPYIEAHGCTKDSPHIKLKFYVDLSWLFSTCIGLILFLVEICIIFFVKFEAVGFNYAAWITSAILVLVLVLFLLISYQIRRTVMAHFMERMGHKVGDLEIALGEGSREFSAKTMGNGHLKGELAKDV